MGKAHERRLRAMMRKADARKKSLLLVKNIVETVMGGAPVLTEIEAFEMGQSFESDEERKQYATMLSALRSLCGCVEETHVKYLEVMVLLTFLGGFFGRAKEYRNFQNLLDELCLKRDGEYSKRLQERIVTTGGLVPYCYNIALEEESDNSKHISLKLSEDELALAKEVTEALEQAASELKAMSKVVRDLMKQYTTPISSFTNSIDDFEMRVREAIKLTKRMLYDTNFELWDDLRESLLNRSDSLLAMMDALPDYDDIVFDEDLFEEKMRSLNKEIADRLKGL